MRIFVAAMLVVCFSMGTRAQSVKGKLLDLLDNTPLAGATVQLSKVKDSTVIFNSVTDSKGLFQFKNISADSFLLRVSYVGYAEYKQFAAPTDSIPDIDMGTLFIPKKRRILM
jgi:hypothetical protein